MYFCCKWAWSPPDNATPSNILAPKSWGIICFCTIDGSFRILKKAGGNIFLKWYYFEEIAKIISFRKIFSSLFQYFERNIASSETNDTSKKRSDTLLFGAKKFEGVALPGGLHAHLQQKDIEKKVNFKEPIQKAKEILFNGANLMLVLWVNCMPIAFELQQGSLWVFTKLPNLMCNGWWIVL